ncbi:hypothetical protein CHS0354_035888 [Potamilus streckersoni]|uniref:AP complex subunit beta n=1 Tax=Potamilus streckersoni TaxID=2493646 RepID=A0AAE0W0H3_9BIVA|nr:hypothetical protein CHS0354_035888 [Potamilus streckersoni]
MEISDPYTLSLRCKDPNVMGDIQEYRNHLAEIAVLFLDRNPKDMAPLFPHIIKLLAHSDFVVKKTACRFLVQFSGSQSELPLLAINTLLQDCQGSNPMIRGLALRTLCSIHHESFQDHYLKAVENGLQDKSSYVRRTAVMCSIALHKFYETSSLAEVGIIDRLYSLIRDPDPVVVINCLLALEEILSSEQGVVLNKNMVNYLLNRISTFTAWGTAYLLNLLKKYQPKNEEEIFDMMNILDPYLQHNSCFLSTSALELFLHLVQSLPHLFCEIFRRWTETIITVLGSGNVELISILLDYMQKFAKEGKDVFSSHYKSFFCCFRDPLYLKKQKINFFPHLLTEDNMAPILDEIGMYCSDASMEISLHAILAMGQIVQVFPKAGSSCLKKFDELLKCGTNHVISNTIQVLETLELKDFPNFDEVVDRIGSVGPSIQTSAGKCSLLSLIGKYGIHMEESPNILEKIIHTFEEEDTLVRIQLLIASLKLFVQRPTECQGLLGSLLEKCYNDEDRDIQAQALYYYHLLQNNVEVLKNVCHE